MGGRRSRARLVAVLGAASTACLLGGAAARAQSGPSDWTNTDPNGGDYNVAGNWDNGVPFNTSAYINGGGTVLVQSTDPLWSVVDLQFGSASPSTSSIITTFNGCLVQTGSTINASGGVNIASPPVFDGGGYSYPTSGYQMGGGTLNVTGGFNVSIQGLGFLNQSAGTINVGGYLTAGNQTGSVGTITLTGGTLTSTGAGLGYVSGQGLANVTGGTWNMSGQDMSIGYGTNAVGVLNVSGTGTVNMTNKFIYVGRGGNGTVNVTPGGTVDAGSTTLVGAGSTGSGTLNISGGTANLKFLGVGALTGGTVSGGTGVVNLNAGGTLNINSASPAISLGYQNAGTGILNISGDATQLNDTRGDIYVGTLTAGTGPSTGLFNMAGGSVSNVAWIYVGRAGIGAFNVSGGTYSAPTGDIIVGDGNTGVGTASFNGSAASTITAANLLIGTNVVATPAGGGNGTVTIAGATVSINQASGSVYVGDANNAAGVLNMSRGTLTTGQLYVGANAVTNVQGILNQSGGTITTTVAGDPIRIGYGLSSVGVYAMSASGLLTDASDFQLGYLAGGVGALYQSGGTINISNGYPSAARQGGTIGVFDISGGVFNQLSSTGKTFNVGEQGIGVLNVRAAGTLNSAGNVDVGASATGSGTVNLLTGGTIAPLAVIKGASTVTKGAVFDFNGGTLASTAGSTAATFMTGLDAAYVYPGGAVIDTTAKSVTIGQPLLAPTGQGVSSVTVAGGTGYQVAPIVQFTGGGGGNATGVATIDANGNLTGITITNPGTGYTSAPTITLYNAGGGSASSLTPVLSNNVATGGLTKLGANTLTLTGASTYGGLTNVSGGTLRVNGSTLSTGAVTVAAAAVLGGNGSVGAVTVKGTITAGPDDATTGTFNTGSQTWATGGTYLAKLAGDNSTADRLVMSGLTYAGTPFTVNVAGTNASSASATYVLATDQSAASGSDPFVVGSLTLTVNTAAAPTGWKLSEQNDAGLGGVDLVLSTASAPEPTSLLLAAVGCAPLLARRRRRNAATGSLRCSRPN